MSFAYCYCSRIEYLLGAILVSLKGRQMSVWPSAIYYGIINSLFIKQNQDFLIYFLKKSSIFCDRKK